MGELEQDRRARRDWGLPPEPPRPALTPAHTLAEAQRENSKERALRIDSLGTVRRLSVRCLTQEPPPWTSWRGPPTQFHEVGTLSRARFRERDKSGGSGCLAVPETSRGRRAADTQTRLEALNRQEKHLQVHGGTSRRQPSVWPRGKRSGGEVGVLVMFGVTENRAQPGNPCWASWNRRKKGGVTRAS